MGISSFADLRQWFFAGIKQKGEDAAEAAPHWNLYAGDYGTREVRIMFNNRISDMAESFQFLENSIRAQNNPDGTRFRVQTYAPGKPNNPTAETYVQIYEKSASPATQQPSGIAGLPAGVGSIEAYIGERVQMEQLKWENQQLREQLGAPTATWERVMEHVASIQGIDKVLQALAIGLVSKFNPQAMPAMQAAMNGTPNAPNGEHDDDDTASPDEVFQQNIMETAQRLGVDPVTLSKKLNSLSRENTDLAKSLLQ